MALFLENPEAAIEWATRAASHLPKTGYVSLEGPLGAGKSLFARTVIGAHGYVGALPSPTYTLLEQYPTSWGEIWHMDLYRLGDAEELEFLGVREAIEGDTCCLIEWAERGRPWLPEASLRVCFDYQGSGRSVEAFGAGAEALLQLP